MNDELRTKEPFEGFSIVCAFLFIIAAALVIPGLFFTAIALRVENFPLLYFIFKSFVKPFVVGLGWTLGLIFLFDFIELPPWS